jgi:hypothetical protein
MFPDGAVYTPGTEYGDKFLASNLFLKFSVDEKVK